MELISVCCTAEHDGRFHYDEDFNEGICSNCLEHATFEEGEDK